MQPPHPDPVDVLAANLKAARKARNLSRRALGEAVGISEGYVSRLERGLRTNPSRPVLEAIARALETTPAALTGTPEER